MKLRRMFGFCAMVLILSASMFLTACGFPYWGTIDVTPRKNIRVRSSDGSGLTNYDLFVYRCTHPGSQFSEVIKFFNVNTSTFKLEPATKKAWKSVGGAWLAPDFFASFEPTPYWVACVQKEGFASRRWSLGESHNQSVTIELLKSSGPGPDQCIMEQDGCTVCRSYEYPMYGVQRYRHDACDAKAKSTAQQ